MHNILSLSSHVFTTYTILMHVTSENKNIQCNFDYFILLVISYSISRLLKIENRNYEEKTVFSKFCEIALF